MVCQSYGKAELCLTSGGGAVTRSHWFRAKLLLKD